MSTDYEYTYEDIEAAREQGYENAVSTDAGLYDARRLGFTNASNIALAFVKEFAPGFLPTLIERLSGSPQG